jgi:acylglycerol lipase
LVDPVAQIVVIHGWASSSNFVEIGCEFAKSGIIAHLFDMRGFGYSGGLRRNSRIEDFLKDLHLVIGKCFSDLPLFLYGHSLGGFIAMKYLILNRIKVSGVLFTSPFVSIPFFWKITKFKKILLNLLGGLCEVNLSYYS